ncbi:MAG: beta-propeller domain-containing protein [Anaerovoracaceae bacterium]|jgi:inhibitor of cysteine peptidase
MRKNIIVFGIFIMAFILFGSIIAAATDEKEQEYIKGEELSSKEAIFLYTGSPLILSDGKVRMLDKENPDIVATVVQSRTLLPLRAIAEYFGAEVRYDQSAREAIIDYEDKRYRFPIGQKKYITEDGSNTVEYVMDTQSVILNDRTMVPIRVISENILNRKVSYFDRIIAIADNEINLKSDEGLREEVRSKIGEAVKARTMKELKLALAGDETPRMATWGKSVDFSRSMDGAALESAANTASDNSYSLTNIQVEGIDEADVVKTDGKYIYIAGNNAVRIVGADNGKLSDETMIRMATNKNVSEIYLADNKLVVIGNRWEEMSKPLPRPAIDGMEIGIIYPMPSRNYSFVDIYDISDPLNPVFVKGHEMEGNYQSSRKNGEIVYLVTNMYLNGDIILPMMKDTVISNESFHLKIDDVMIMPRYPSRGYLVVSAININNKEKTEVEAITAHGAIMYMNESSLYIAVNDWSSASSIIKFNLEGMKIGYAGSGEVKGYLLNQFSMDEYEGYLRVATTSRDKGNGVYVFDESLNVVGSVEGLAEGETIYSVRFLGERGYIVTFRTIDPLFVFDLSDPKNPVVTGELKIPGFSNYLHPVGKNLLLGIGADTYEIFRRDNSGEEVVIGTRQGGIKFSLFDVSNMGKPKEISKYVVGDSGSSSEAFYNHKAIMIDEASGNVAIDAYLYFEKPEKGYQRGAVIMDYNNKELSLRGILESEYSGIYGNYIPNARRIIYIGDQLYYIQEGTITSYDYDSLKKIDTMVLR